MFDQRKIRQCLGIVIAALSFSQTAVWASGFQLFEENGADIGNAHAGGAAIAEDASTGFYNPAGLTRIHNQQLVVSDDAIITHAHFTGNNTWSTPFYPFTYTESGSANSGGTHWVPQLHYVAPLSDQWAFGFNVTTPFGLATDYANTSFVRYSATHSRLETIDLSPSFAYAFDNHLSLGAGFDAEKINAELDAVAGIPVIATPSPVVLGRNLDSLSENKANGWGYGWHFGALYQVNPCTRVGLSYRSQMRFHMKGESDLSGPMAEENDVSSLRNRNLWSDVTLPPTTMLSLYHELDKQWSLLGTLAYTQWDTFGDVRLHNVQAVAPPILAPSKVTVDLPQHYRNTWMLAVGTNYRINPQWVVKAGVGYDQSPVVGGGDGPYIRLPDNNRVFAALGGHYQATKAVGLDLGWQHLFIKDGSLINTSTFGTQVSRAQGRTNGSADVIGTQLTWDII